MFTKTGEQIIGCSLPLESRGTSPLVRGLFQQIFNFFFFIFSVDTVSNLSCLYIWFLVSSFFLSPSLSPHFSLPLSLFLFFHHLHVFSPFHWFLAEFLELTSEFTDLAFCSIKSVLYCLNGISKFPWLYFSLGNNLSEFSISIKRGKILWEILKLEGISAPAPLIATAGSKSKYAAKCQKNRNYLFHFNYSFQLCSIMLPGTRAKARCRNTMFW